MPGFRLLSRNCTNVHIHYDYCNMKNLFLLSIALLILPELARSQERYLNNIIPIPVKYTVKNGSFILNGSTTILYSDKNTRLAKYLHAQLKSFAGINLRLIEGKHDKLKNGIILRIYPVPDNKLGHEGYKLDVSEDRVLLSANGETGLFYGIQSLLQMMPVRVANSSALTIPCTEITDYPRFGWRGLMLDVSRHFFSFEFLKRFIDEMVKYKFNVFHLHLTDDQGWRIEIKGMPKLTKVGAWRVPRQGSWLSFDPPQPDEDATYGGYYTQDQIKELIKYASEHNVTVVPEIDVPGHCLALIAAYPELSCTHKQYEVNPGSRFKDECNVLCVANEATWHALDKIFTQVAELFPCEYIHIGGDEANREFWNQHEADKVLMQKEGIENLAQLQSYFTKKLEKLILSKGKRIIGWDEISEGGLAPEATVMSWRGMDGGVQSAQLGHHVIMSPTTHAYLDYYQGDPVVEPEAGGMLRLKSCYDFDPLPPKIDKSLILGGQGNLWTESIPTGRHAEYMTWPRAFALAEVLWSPVNSKNWTDFIRRMEWQFDHLDKAGVNYARSVYDIIITSVKGAKGDYLVKMTTEIPGLDIYYTFDGTNPDVYLEEYKGEPLAIPKGASQVRVRTYRNGKPVGAQINFILSQLQTRLEP